LIYIILYKKINYSKLQREMMKRL